MTEKEDKFWYEEPSILFDKNRIVEFFPTEDMTYFEKLNAITRLSIYSSVLLYMYKKEYYFFYFPLFIIGLTLYMYKTNSSDSCNVTENFSSCDTCTKPSQTNPFMNVLMQEYTDNPNRGKACSIEETEADVEKKFNHNLYRRVGDIWQKNNNQRQFYTMPNTTIPNKQKEFAEWLYKIPRPTCREDPKYCEFSEDIRYNRQKYPIETSDGGNSNQPRVLF